MTRSLLLPLLLVALALLGGCAKRAPVSTADTSPRIFDNLGTHHHEITTRSPHAQRYFDQGLRLAYAFNHEEARLAFKEAARIDPDCAMCWWGVAYTLGTNYNLPADPERDKEAWTAIEKARAAAPHASERERAYVEAIAKRFVPNPPANRYPLDEAWANAIGEVAKRYPDDLDAATIHAEALMNLQPWDLWTHDGKPKGRTLEIVAELERVLAADPQHPGANHYYIHAVEASHDPGRGVGAADRLRAQNLGAGHLVHMPSHIYVRTGRYADATEANAKAIAVDEAYIRKWDIQGDYAHMYYPHNVHFRAFSAGMEGRSAESVDNARSPNLRYRVQRRSDATEDLLEEVRKHPGEAGIIYCIRRSDVDDLSSELRRAKIKAAPYHAGMDDEDRTRTQDRFASGDVDVVVATVAFGMGIDRSDIRFVLHAAMPKSIEHYQQETGRAGRDGKPADCVLFYSGQDFQMWNSIISKNESGDLDTKQRMLSQMYNFCTGARCRHRRLVEYFGQPWARTKCEACDVCEGGLDALPDSTILAQKILSCIARTQQRYGPAYVAEVLTGDATDRVQERGHDRLSTFGLLKEQPKPSLISWMHQLVDQGALQVEGDYGILRLTDKGSQIMRALEEAVLYPIGTGAPKKKEKKSKKSAAAKGETTTLPLRGADGDLYEALRELRRELADSRNVPAFMIFSDKALRGMAHARPTTPTAFLQIHGVGMTKLEQFGDTFMALIKNHTAK